MLGVVLGRLLKHHAREWRVLEHRCVPARGQPT